MEQAPVTCARGNVTQRLVVQGVADINRDHHEARQQRSQQITRPRIGGPSLALRWLIDLNDCTKVTGSTLGKLNMTTERQTSGNRGVVLVVQRCKCPRCERKGTLKKLPPNFKCADIICDFCGYLAQVKTKALTSIPSMLAGAAWIPQKERMDAGIYFPLFLVLVGNGRTMDSDSVNLGSNPSPPAS